MLLIRLSLFSKMRILKVRICSPAQAVIAALSTRLCSWMGESPARETPAAEPQQSFECRELVFSLPQPCRMSGCTWCLCSSEGIDNTILPNSAVPGKSPQILLLALICAPPNTRLTEPASILWWICLFSVIDTKKKLPERQILKINTQPVPANIPESSQKSALLNGANSKPDISLMW